MEEGDGVDGKGDDGDGEDEGVEDRVEIGRLRMEIRRMEMLLLESCPPPTPDLNRSSKGAGQSKPIRQLTWGQPRVPEIPSSFPKLSFLNDFQ